MVESETVLILEMESVPASLLVFEFWSVAGAVVFDGSDGCCCCCGCWDSGTMGDCVDVDDDDCSGGGGDDDDTGNGDSSSTSLSLSAISSIWSIDLSDLIDLIDNDRVTLDGISSICVECTGTVSLFDSEFVSMISGGVGLLTAIALVAMALLFGLLDDVIIVVLLMTDTIEPPVDSSTTVSATGNR